MLNHRDYFNEIIKIGSRVRILCDNDKTFFNKIGIVTLINPPDYKRYPFDIFVQMVTGGGGLWWRAQYVKIEPKPRRKSGKGMKKRMKRAKEIKVNRNVGS